MKTFELNGIDVIYWFDVEQYHKEHGDKKRVLVWHGDSIAEFVFNAIEEIPIGMKLGAYNANGDFVFYDHDKIRHTVFKNSNKWKIWKEMDEYLKYLASADNRSELIPATELDDDFTIMD